MPAVGTSSGARGLLPIVKSGIKSVGYKRGAMAAAAVVGTGAMLRRRKSGLDNYPGRPTGIRNY